MGVKEILVLLILFGANLLQAITGFAGTLISMPPTMKLIGVDEGTAQCNCTDFQSDDCNYRIPAY